MAGISRSAPVRAIAGFHPNVLSAGTTARSTEVNRFDAAIAAALMAMCITTVNQNHRCVRKGYMTFTSRILEDAIYFMNQTMIAAMMATMVAHPARPSRIP